MYARRNRRNPFGSIALILLAGILAGVGYLAFDSARGQRTPTAAVPTAQPSLIPPTTSAAQTALPTPTTPPTTSLFIPKVGLSAPIITAYLDGVSWDVTQLGANVGHLQGTSDPGSTGNSVLAGHVTLRDGSSGIFAAIKDMVVGDRVYVTRGEQEWRYAVVSRAIVPPSDLSVVYPTEDERLTLITCESYDFFTDSYLERVVVVAERVG